MNSPFFLLYHKLSAVITKPVYRMLQCRSHLVSSWGLTHLAVDECVKEAVNNIALGAFLEEEPVSVSGYISS